MRIWLYIILLFALHTVNAQTPVSININPTNTPKGKMMLGDLVESLEYISLETTEKCLIGQISRFDVSKNYILIYCGKTNAVYLFKRDGRFISQISSAGQGPEEYIRVNNVFIDEHKNVLILCATYKNLFFNLSGQFLHAVNHKNVQTPLWAYFNNQLLSGMPSGMFPETFPVYKLWSIDMELIASFVESVRVENKLQGDGGSIMSPGYPFNSYIYNGEPHVQENTLNDTIYVFNNNNLNPKYILSTGKYGITAEQKGSFNLDFLTNSAIVRSVAETKTCILFQYSYKKVYYSAYYIKESRKLEYFDSMEECIPNNFDGGLDFWPKLQINNEWYCFYDAPDFLNKATKHKSLTPIISQTSSRKYKDLVKKLNTEDNPVLVVAKTNISSVQ